MSERVFFDTTILLYTIAKGDARTEIAERLVVAGGVISVQVLNEFVAVARRKLRMPWEDLSETLDAIRVLCETPLPMTVELHERGLSIASRYGFQIYDALIVAAALSASCRVLYSEDMQNGQRFDSLVIRNPFVA
jgi:predicted nucleic acid-binding protein